MLSARTTPPPTCLRPPRGRVGSGPADVAKKCGFRTFWLQTGPQAPVPGRSPHDLPWIPRISWRTSSRARCPALGGPEVRRNHTPGIRLAILRHPGRRGISSTPRKHPYQGAPSGLLSVEPHAHDPRLRKRDDHHEGLPAVRIQNEEGASFCGNGGEFLEWGQTPGDAARPASSAAPMTGPGDGG